MAMLAKILRSLSPLAFAAAALTLIAPAPLVAQTAAPSLVPNRLTQPVDENSRVTLKGTVSPLAKAANDRGAAPASMPLDRLTLVLKRSAAQESALRQFISDMHTPGTASYHKWLTPEQFGKQFGPSDQDIATVEAWLQSKGFSVTKVNAGKQTIEMSGSASQFSAAFHAQIHKYMVNGETHYANATDPQIPTALAPVIGGFATLNNFRVKNNARILGKASYDPKTSKVTPGWTTSSGGSIPNFVLSPADYAVQYDLNPLYAAGTNGSGQTIAIVNDSNINIYLVNQFRTLFGLSANPPQVIIDGNDPGVDGINNPDGPNFDSGEAYLDVEWSGAVAPNATIDLVIGADTALEDGLFLALEHAIYGNIAPVVSLSFGNCEVDLGATNQFLNGLYEQAAAQGITVLVSSGDNGSAACDNDNTQFYAVDGQQVSGFASTPYNVAVGGTDFYYSDYNNSAALPAQLATFWNTTPSNNTPMASIKGVIPEQPWNSSQFGFNIFDILTESGGAQTSIAAGSGGASNCATGTVDPSTGTFATCTAGYPKPTWQKGAGVPADKVRDLPDLSLFASSGANASFFPICATDGDCQLVSGSGTVQITGVGGTSASTPSFAGIMAMVNQKYGAQGQADFVLYPLATQFPAAFHDVTVGSISVPCNITTTSVTGNPAVDCIAVSSPPMITDPTFGEATEGQIGSGTTPQYNAGAGYDLASGLGSVDANVLVTDWNKVTFTTSTTTLTPSSTSFAHGTSITVSGSVTPGTATGSVALVTNSTEPVQQGTGLGQVVNGSTSTFALTNGSFTGPVNDLPGGTYDIWGQYSGDGTNGASASQKTSITVTPEASGVYFNLFSPAGTSTSGSIVSGASIDYGTQLLLSAQVAPSSQLTALENCFTTSAACPVFGIPTGTVAFADNGATINTAVINAEGDAEYNAPFAIGSHSVTASYAGDNSYNKSTAPAVTFTVAKDTPALNISASNLDSNTGAYFNNQPTVFNIQVLNGAAVNFATSTSVFPVPIASPTGTVTVTGFPSGVPTTPVTLTPAVDPMFEGREGVATITAPAGIAAGNYNVTINYSGDVNYMATSANGTVSIESFTGGLASTTTATAAGSISPATSIAITGTVTGQSGHPAPTGSIIIFSSGNYTNIEAGLSPGTGNSSTFSTVLNSQSLFQGTNFVTLQYTGDNNYYPSAFQLTSAVLSPLSDFSVVPETTIVPLTSGGSGTDTINAYSINGFSGAVSFTCGGTTVTCTVSSSATLSSGSTSPLTLTINAGSSVASGNYNVLVTGVDSTGKFVHTLAIEAAVSGTPGYALTAAPTTLSLVPGATTNNTSVVSVTPSNGFTGTVNLTCAVTGPTGATSPATCSLNPTSADVTGATAVTSTLTVDTTATTTPGAYAVTVTGVSGTITETTTVTANVVPFTVTAMPTTLSFATGADTGNTSTISVTPFAAFTGNVALACAVTGPTGATSPATCALNPPAADLTGTAAATSILTLATTATTTPGAYTVTVTGMSGSLISTATVTATVTAAVVPPSFTLTPNPTTLTLVAGATTGNTSVITVVPASGFSATVALTCAVTGPAGATSPATCTPAPASTTTTSTVTIGTTATTTPGSYTATVTGMSTGVPTATATVTITVTAPPAPTFALTNSGSITVTQPNSGTSTITVTPSNGFTGNVALTCAVSSTTTGVGCTLNPTTADVTGASAVTSMLTVTTGANSAKLNRPLDKFFTIAGGSALAMLLFFGIPARRRSWRTMLGVVLFAALVGIGIGCGGGSMNKSATYTVTVTGTSGTLTETTTVSVTVTQ
jgi:subtilase family serine protease